MENRPTLRIIFPDEPDPQPHCTLRYVYPEEIDQRQASGIVEEVILKPRGELGRPGRGGYKLRDALSWSPKLYTEVQVFFRAQVDKHLINHLPYTKQEQQKVAQIIKEAKEKFPVLNKYHDDWAAYNFVQSALKNCRRNRRL